MPITGLPTFTAKTKLLAAQLNQAMTALTSKFNGAITGSDMAWPLVAQGNLNLNGNQILRVGRFRNVYNIAEYTSNIQGLFDTVAAAGGGTIYVPANTTIDMSGITCTVSGGLHIYGEGQTSVFRKTGGSTTDMLRLSVAGGLTISNLKFDGNSVGTSTNALLRLSTCTGARIDMVSFESGGGYGVLLDYITAAGSGCSNVFFSMCRWLNFIVADAVRVEDAQNVYFTACNWLSNTKICVNMAPQNNASYAKNVNITNSQFLASASVTQPTIKFRDSSAAAPNATQYGLTVRGCSFNITVSSNVAMIEAWYCGYQSYTGNHITYLGGTKPCIYIRKSSDIIISDNLFPAVAADAIVISHLGGTDATTISEGVLNLTVNDNSASAVGGRFLVVGLPKYFSIMNNTVVVGNSLAYGGTVGQIALWSVPNGAANNLHLHGRICFNTYGTGYSDVAEITTVGHGGASSNVGGGGFDSRLVVIGNINQGVAVSITGGLTNAGDINDTVIADAHVNELNVGA